MEEAVTKFKTNTIRYKKQMKKYNLLWKLAPENASAKAMAFARGLPGAFLF